MSDEEKPAEVLRFEASKERLESYKAQHPKIFAELERIQEEYNTALEAADKAVREKNISAGDWQIYQVQTKIDADKLYEELGEADFLRVGGVVETKTVYSIDRAKFATLEKSGGIPQEVLDAAVKKSPRYHAPEKIRL
jgi:hypothetical protein